MSLIHTGMIKRLFFVKGVSMAALRLSKAQKQSLLMIHYIELSHGIHTPVNTSYIRKKVDAHLGTVTAPNNFRVSLHTLAEKGYLVFQPNTDQLINSNVREDENMWQLTELGRQWAETEHCHALTPKRQYRRTKA